MFVWLALLWLALLICTTYASAVLLGGHILRNQRPLGGPNTHNEAFANSVVSTNMLPHAVEVAYAAVSVRAMCAAASALKYAMMYTKTPAMSADNARVCRFFVVLAANAANSGQSIDKLYDMSLDSMIDIINQHGWLSESAMPFTGVVPILSLRNMAMASTNGVKISYSTLSNSAEARTVIDRGSPFVLGFSTLCETVNGKETYPTDSLKTGDILPMPSANAKACHYTSDFHAIVSAYDTGKQAFYIEVMPFITTALGFYVPFAFFDKYISYAFAVDSVTQSPPPAPPPGTSVTARITPGNPTRLSLTQDGWYGLAKVTNEIRKATNPYSDAIVTLYDAVYESQKAILQLVFTPPASDGSTTLNVSAFYIASNVSITLSLDGAETKMDGGAGTNYAERSFTFKKMGAPGVVIVYHG